jgi:predicted dehydrogenase
LIGKKRLAGLPAGARLAVACDVDRARAEELVQRAGSGRAVIDYREAVADVAVDAVVVAALNAALAPIALAAVQAGKHVLIEKPGALNSGQLRALQEATSKAGVKVRIGYNLRFHPGMCQARELVDAGALGPLMFLRARYGHGGRVGYDREWRADPAQSGGGELIDQGVHLIDLARWLLGEPTAIAGHCATSFWDMPVDDNAFISLRTATGQTAWMHASCSEWKNLFSLELYGRIGKVAVEGLGGSYGVERCTFYRMLPQMGPPETQTWEYPAADDSWARETAAFIADIQTGREASPGLTDGIRTLEIVEELYRRSGYPVNMASLLPNG